MTDENGVAAGPAPIDYPMLLDGRCRGKQELAIKLMRNLLEDSGPRWLIEAQEVVKEGDLVAVARIGHSIKGSCKMLYAHTMVKAGMKLEKAGKEGSMAEIDNALEELNIAFQQTSEWLRENPHLFVILS